MMKFDINEIRQHLMSQNDSIDEIYIGSIQFY